MSSKTNVHQGWKILRGRAARPVTFDPEPETICYRGQTLAIVRHFFEISCQLGRLPSILGREFFRAKVSHQGIPSFKDQALFTHDVERALQKLGDEAMEVITLVGLYDLSHQEAAEMLHRSEGCISQRYAEAVAQLTQIFLDTGLVSRNKPDRRQTQMKGRKVPRKAPARKKPCGTARRDDLNRRQAQVIAQEHRA